MTLGPSTSLRTQPEASQWSPKDLGRWRLSCCIVGADKPPVSQVGRCRDLKAHQHHAGGPFPPLHRKVSNPGHWLALAISQPALPPHSLPPPRLGQELSGLSTTVPWVRTQGTWRVSLLPHGKTLLPGDILATGALSAPTTQHESCNPLAAKVAERQNKRHQKLFTPCLKSFP